MVLSAHVCERVSVRVRVFGVGVTPHAWNGGCRGGRRRRGGGPVCSGVQAVMVQSGAVKVGGEFGVWG